MRYTIYLEEIVFAGGKEVSGGGQCFPGGWFRPPEWLISAVASVNGGHTRAGHFRIRSTECLRFPGWRTWYANCCMANAATAARVKKSATFRNHGSRTEGHGNRGPRALGLYRDGVRNPAPCGERCAREP